MSTRLVIAGAVGVALLAVAACGEDDGTSPVPKPQNRIEILTPGGDSLALGDSIQLRARRLDPNGSPLSADSSKFLWESTDTTVLMVDAAGKASIVGLGTAEIRARFEDPATPGTASATDTATATLTLSGAPVVFHAGPLLAASTASFHHCVVLNSGAAECRGRNNVGQVGIGSLTPITDSVATWTRVVGGLAFTSIATTGTTCARATDGRAYCWGDNSLGQFGIGRRTPANSPSPVEVGDGSHRWLQIETRGHNQTCGVTTANIPLCVGHNDWGQVGREPRTSTDSILGEFGTGHLMTMVRTGDFLTCGLKTDGSVWCSGEGGEPTNSEGGAHGIPTRIGGSTVFTSITVGQYHGCGLDAAGAAYCWGRSEGGELGTGDATSSGTPRPVAGGHTFSRIFAWLFTTCGVTTSGETWCWGSNQGRALGRTRLTSSAVPIRVRIGANVKWIDRATGARGACAINASSQLVCWGPFTREVPAAGS